MNKTVESSGAIHRMFLCGISAVTKQLLHRDARRGITFISIFISLLVLSIGLVTLLRVYPVIDKLSGRAKAYVSFSMIADRVFTVIEQVYGDTNGPAVPSYLYGVDEDFPEFSYSAYIHEVKQGLYETEVEITGKREGKVESEYFYGSFRRQ